MKQVIGEILREFYENGVPKDVKGRHLDFVEKKRTATVVMGMRRTVRPQSKRLALGR